MGVKVNIEIKNMAQFKAAFRQSPTVVKKHLNKAIRLAALRVGRLSRQLTPVDTGRLRASHREVFKPLYAEIGTYVNYDIFVHEGTRYMKARPFMQRAAEESEGDIQRDFERALQEAMNEIARKV